ncbi:hypothetical protein ACIBM3_28995 [Rhodococcus erythropolis]|uniref:hypothetical protein n=1 Tax=Rhodococcus erythropolis TaxID=1833 RepID=UPI0037B4DC85
MNTRVSGVQVCGFDPRSRDRLATIAANLRDRIVEARINGWTGEVSGLTVSLDAAVAKLATLDRMRGTEHVVTLPISVSR